MGLSPTGTISMLTLQISIRSNKQEKLYQSASCLPRNQTH